MPDSEKRMTQEEYIEAIIVALYQSEKPFCNIREIATVLGVNQSTLPKYLNYLLGEGIYLEMYKSGPTKNYLLTEEGKAKAEEILKEKREKS